MRRDRAMRLLEAVARGEVPPGDALDALALPPTEAVADFAQLDHHRALRQGVPEVVFGAGKTAAQCVAIAERFAALGDGFLVTRAEPVARDALLARFPGAVASELGRTVRLAATDAAPPREAGVRLVTAGTADLPVAEECAETLAALGLSAQRITDVGVAGLHRVLAHASTLASAAVTVVVAGMDGALPSVVGGMARGPVIAVPTSVGYGAAFGGLAPLLTMLNSCAAGVVVVNIDNGFGAAVAAARIVQHGNDLRGGTSG